MQTGRMRSPGVTVLQLATVVLVLLRGAAATYFGNGPQATHYGDPVTGVGPCESLSLSFTTPSLYIQFSRRRI